jgi:5-methylcytosine-specific restriction endonuclease McrA
METTIRRAKVRAWYAKNRERQCARRRAYDATRREHRRDQNRKYRERNLQKCRDAFKKHYARNKRKILDKSLKWQRNNPEKTKEYQRAWLKRNPGIYSRRRAIKRNAVRGCQKRVARIYKRCQYWRQWFNVEVDHIIPLAFGGAHSANNLQIIYRSENSRKRDNPFYVPSVIFL